MAASPAAAVIDHRLLPLFPRGASRDDTAVFQPILDAYEGQHWDDAIEETLRIRAELQLGPLDETAAFLLGDLYAARANHRETADLRRALQAFEDARLRYPHTENAVRALWRIGQTYSALGFSHEAVGSFKRVVARHAESPYAAYAQLDLAELYRGWELWTEADGAYRALRSLPLTPADQIHARLGSADVVARLGRYEEAYQMYREAEAHAREDARALFRYAETAYHTGRYGDARDLFLSFFNIYSRDPLAPVAYAYVGDTLRIEGKTRNAELTYDDILAKPAESLGGTLALLMAAMGKRLLHGCAPIPSGFDDAPCRVEATPTQDPRPLAHELAAQARTLIRDRPTDPTLRRLVFDAATFLRGHGLFDIALELHHEIVAILPPSPIRNRLSAVLHETAGSAVLSYAEARDDLSVIRFFYGSRSAFTPSMLNGPLGLTIADSHARLGLLAQTIELSSPIAANRTHPKAEDALFLLADAFRRRGDLEKARQRFEQFLTRYPASRRAPEALAYLADVLDRQGRTQDATARYRTWLDRYPHHQDAEAITLRLTRALGDASYAAGRYAEAIRHYRAALAASSTNEAERGWFQLQLGRSYRAIGERDQSLALFKLVAGGTTDTLVARFAALHVEDLELQK
ncbi:MAG: tetratricopeptide repeat protein [Nitrospirae bacterium]|nr:tetratricopeptide repeat protein [Nitrospirota bacterium]